MVWQEIRIEHDIIQSVVAKNRKSIKTDPLQLETKKPDKTANKKPQRTVKIVSETF